MLEIGVLALGVAGSAYGAFTLARTALAASFDALREELLQNWDHWGSRLQLPRPDDGLQRALSGSG